MQFGQPPFDKINYDTISFSSKDKVSFKNSESNGGDTGMLCTMSQPDIYKHVAQHLLERNEKEREKDKQQYYFVYDDRMEIVYSDRVYVYRNNEARDNDDPLWVSPYIDLWGVCEILDMKNTIMKWANGVSVKFLFPIMTHHEKFILHISNHVFYGNKLYGYSPRHYNVCADDISIVTNKFIRFVKYCDDSSNVYNCWNYSSCITVQEMLKMDKVYIIDHDDDMPTLPDPEKDDDDSRVLPPLERNLDEYRDIWDSVTYGHLYYESFISGNQYWFESKVMRDEFQDAFCEKYCGEPKENTNEEADPQSYICECDTSDVIFRKKHIGSLRDCQSKVNEGEITMEQYDNTCYDMIGEFDYRVVSSTSNNCGVYDTMILHDKTKCAVYKIYLHTITTVELCCDGHVIMNYGNTGFVTEFESATEGQRLFSVIQIIFKELDRPFILLDNDSFLFHLNVDSFSRVEKRKSDNQICVRYNRTNEKYPSDIYLKNISESDHQRFMKWIFYKMIDLEDYSCYST